MNDGGNIFCTLQYPYDRRPAGIHHRISDIEPPGIFTHFLALLTRMHETANAFLHFDPPLQGLTGGAILQGWMVGKTGHHYTDVRTRVGDLSFPGVHGIPREDLAQFFKSSRRY